MQHKHSAAAAGNREFLMFVNNRSDARRFFIDVWNKYREKRLLEPIEQMILDVILAHPEYHTLLEQGEASLHEDFLPGQGKTNPFLHMSMHVAIKEQIQADRPAGIRELCRVLAEKLADDHVMEHQVMECLGESLWQAQRDRRLPDEQAYLECVKALK